MQKSMKAAGCLAALLTLVLTGACVERTVRIETDPPGAAVIVNDEEVGVSPAKFAFVWYGDYDLILRKPGYETLKTHYRVTPPWYQWPPFDIVAETLIPAVIRDEHTLPPYALAPASEPAASELVERATELRDRALFKDE